MDVRDFKEKIFKISSFSDFEILSMQLFKHQVKTNPFYKKYCKSLNTDIGKINSIDHIPFMPIYFFKTEKILCNSVTPETHFISSGTSSSKKSKHHIESIEFYEKNITACFKEFWGDIHSYKFFCLTPQKKEAKNSSLVHMCDFFVKKTKHLGSGFYLNKDNKLKNDIIESQKHKQPFILIGLTFAILDFANKHKIKLTGGNIIETGGMKNQKKEIIREELYDILTRKFQIKDIQSEYGMTELLSQSYSLKNGEFMPPPWKKVLIRDKQNPLKINNNSTGGINIIDLANIHSCAFIATDDFGLIKNNHFKVLGRLETASIRGCSTMI